MANYKILLRLGASEMEIRKIKAETITDTVEKLFKDLNYNIGNEIERIENYTYEHLNIERNECFGDITFIKIENPETMSVDIILKSASIYCLSEYFFSAYWYIHSLYF